MGKRNKKKSFWGDDSVTERSQMEGIDDLIRLTQIVESGDPIPEVDFTDDDSSGSIEFNANLSAGIGDAVSRLAQKNASKSVDAEPYPTDTLLCRVSSPTEDSRNRRRYDIDSYTRVDLGGGKKAAEIRDMEAVEPVQEDDEVELAPPPKMQARALTLVTARQVIPDEEDVYTEENDEDDDFEYDDKPLEFSDFQIVYTDGDDWLYVSNPYNMDQRVSFSTFNLRGYRVEKNDAYNLMVKYIPIMIALLSGPALIVDQNDETFVRFMSLSVARNIHVDKTKFMIFTVGRNPDAKMFIIYVIDTSSRRGILESVLPLLVERSEETDFFVQLAGLVLNPIINPYGMTETLWPADRASEELDSPEKVEEFCNLMGNELGIGSDMVGTPSEDSMSEFMKTSVIGDIQKFLKTIAVAKSELEKQMTPDNYEEAFLEEREDSENSEEECDAEFKEDDSEGLFEGVGENISDDTQKDPDPAEEPSENNAAESVKPPKAGADGKRANKRFEIPIRR